MTERAKIKRYKAGTIGLAERMWLHTDRSPGCWEWLGTKNQQTGYGIVRHDRRPMLAHRAMYELLIGPIPEGLTIDHLCFNRSCVNPSHLEVVTRGENSRRGEKNRKTRSGGAWMGKRTRCLYGHKLTGDNVRMQGNARICRACAKRRQDEFRQRRAVA